MFDRLTQLNAQSFAQGARTPFRVITPGQPPLALRLVDVSESDVPGTEQFSLIFAGPAEPMLSQGMRQIDHDTLGTFVLFLVPVGRDGATAMYQAVFNRLTQGR